MSVERIVSGRGIVTVYEFLWARHKKTNGIELDKDMPPKMLELYQKVMQSTEGGKVIQENETKDELCRHCISMVLSAYGAETGNLGLKFMPYGGLFIAGGIILKVRELSSFIEPHRAFLQLCSPSLRVKARTWRFTSSLSPPMSTC